MTALEAEQLLEETTAKLAEFFDAVQIMVSWNEERQTRCSKRGSGNWYARQGMAHEFINADMAQEIGVQIADRMPPAADEGDDWKEPKTP